MIDHPPTQTLHLQTYFLPKEKFPEILSELFLSIETIWIFLKAYILHMNVLDLLLEVKLMLIRIYPTVVICDPV